jgi:hypothetical protein
VIAVPVEGVDAWPLYWPEGWKRSKDRSTSRYETHFVKARDGVLRSLKLMRVSDVLISSNIPLRKDGLPLANMAEPSDPGVAVYWVERKTTWLGDKYKESKVTRVLACDRYRKVRDNLHAIGLTLEAFRAIQRAGASEVLDRAFTGFVALPANAGARSWRVVLGLEGSHVSVDVIERVYRHLAIERHPDRGGTHDQMVELNNARAQALREAGR